MFSCLKEDGCLYSILCIFDIFSLFFFCDIILLANWDVALCATCKTDPKFCIVGCCCPWCISCYQRELLLYDKMEEYLCCQGVFGTACCCPNQVKKCPHCCLCLEVCCCLGCSIKGGV